MIVGQQGYEGAAEVWECSRDLSEYLRHLWAKGDSEDGERLGKLLRRGESVTVLELGCGQALPSMTVAELRGDLPTQLILQDLTEPPTALHHVTALKCTWEDLVNVPLSQPVDLVLMSETLYRVEHFAVLTKILGQLFTVNPACVCLSAQKRFYFGCGGGGLPYHTYLLDNNVKFKCTFIKRIEDQSSNVRDICLLQPS